MQLSSADLLDVLDDDLLVVVAEQQAVRSVPDLLAFSAGCRRLEAACRRIGVLRVRHQSELSVALLRRFTNIRSLEVDGCQARWIPRLAATLAMVPGLTSLSLHPPRD